MRAPGSWNCGLATARLRCAGSWPRGVSQHIAAFVWWLSSILWAHFWLPAPQDRHRLCIFWWRTRPVCACFLLCVCPPWLYSALLCPVVPIACLSPLLTPVPLFHLSSFLSCSAMPLSLRLLVSSTPPRLPSQPPCPLHLVLLLPTASPSPVSALVWLTPVFPARRLSRLPPFSSPPYPSTPALPVHRPPSSLLCSITILACSMRRALRWIRPWVGGLHHPPSHTSQLPVNDAAGAKLCPGLATGLTPLPRPCSSLHRGKSASARRISLATCIYRSRLGSLHL